MTSDEYRAHLWHLLRTEGIGALDDLEPGGDEQAPLLAKAQAWANEQKAINEQRIIAECEELVARGEARWVATEHEYQLDAGRAKRVHVAGRAGQWDPRRNTSAVIPASDEDVAAARAALEAYEPEQHVEQAQLFSASTRRSD